MDTFALLKDQKAQAAWLGEQKARVEARGDYFSFWFHETASGFGLVVTGDERSMEFHLMPDRTVTCHVEKFNPAAGASEILVNETRPAHTLAELDREFLRLLRLTTAYS